MESRKKIDRSTIKKLFEEEKKFISNLLSLIAIPSHEQEEDGDDVYVGSAKPSREEARKNQRAKSFQELNDRLKKLQGTKDFSIKSKLMKKSLSRRIKKKNRKEERSAKRKLIKMKKREKGGEIKTETDKIEPIQAVVKPATTKPVFNSQGKMVFSKFDFSESGVTEVKKKGERDPKKILDTLKKHKDTINELKESGETDKAVHLMEKITWKNALAKAEGQKIKDDPLLLKKTVKKQEQKKKQSAKKWEQRLTTVQKSKDDRQKKRETNLDKRKQDKKKKVFKKAAKKGRMIP